MELLEITIKVRPNVDKACMLGNNSDNNGDGI